MNSVDMENSVFEPFFLLKEIQSLEKNSELLLGQTKDQVSRISKLNQMKASRETDQQENQVELSKIKIELSNKEQALNQLNLMLEQLKSSERNITNQNELVKFENTKSEYEAKIQKIEKEIFEILEREEYLENEIKVAADFLNGVIKTILEIELEVSAIENKNRKLLQFNEERINLSLSSLPESFISKYNYARKKHAFRSPITVIEDNRCGQCAFLLSKLVISKVDQGNLETCPQCSRILLPHKVCS